MQAQGPDGKVAEATAAQAELERLRQALSEKDQALAEKERLYLRALADFDNYRKRTERDLAELREAGKRDFILGLLEVADSFDRALAGSGEQTPAPALLAGMRGIHQQLLALLERHGVAPFASAGQPVDPNRHEVIATAPAPGGHPPDTVLHEAQRGYTMGEKVLRPARVQVAKADEA